MDTLQAALTYYSLGWSIVPCPLREKHPATPWKEYQKTRAQEKDIYKWFKKPSNLALITGALSRVIVLDVDGEPGRASIQGKELPPTPCVRTGSGGLHYYFRHPGFETGNWAGKLPGVDFRGDGGLVILPPSIHPNGNAYEWLIQPHDVPLAPAPDWFTALIQPVQIASSLPAVEPHLSIGDGSPYGLGALHRAVKAIHAATEHTRNMTLFRVAAGMGHLVAGGEVARSLVEDELTTAALDIGLPEYEVRATVKSGLDKGALLPRSAPDGSLWQPHVEKTYLRCPPGLIEKRRRGVPTGVVYVRADSL